MKLGIRLHLTGFSLSDTVSVPDMLDVDRCRTTGRNWVQKANLQPLDEKLDHVAVDDTVIQLNDDRDWLYVAADPDTPRLLHVRLNPRESKR